MGLNPGTGRRRVVAIGLDSAGADQIERYMASGVLPRIRRLREAGALAVLSNRAHYAGGSAPQAITEGCWVEVQTGVRSRKSGYWEAVRYDPARYDARSDPVRGSYDYREFAPFYALGSGVRVATLDVPVAALCAGVDGLQVLGWGGHFPFVDAGSQPKGLLEEISAAYGPNPILYRDAGVFWNARYLAWLEQASVDSVRTRTRLCLDLLAREPWDLFLAVFGETHGAGHDLWFAGDPGHPVHAAWRESHDPLARVFAAVDQAIGEIADRVPDDCHFVLFSPNGMAPNVTDVATFFLLPELLYRLNFPGRIGFAAGDPALPPPPAIPAGRHANWYGEIWRRRHVEGRVRRWLNERLPAWLVCRRARTSASRT